MRFLTQLLIFFITTYPALSHASSCKNKILVGIIDTGIDSTHEMIRDTLWQDPSRKDRVYGWDFVLNAQNPIDEHGHGTHIGGIINQVTNCAILMPIKYYEQNSPAMLNVSRSVKALKYAVDHGVKVINYSGGGPESNDEERQILEKANEKGIIVIVAAGNDHHNIDTKEYHYYPASYALPNIIIVANVRHTSDGQDKLALSSNWGRDSVDVATYGEDILSSIPNKRYAKMTGTSQSTAFVSGYIVELLSQHPHLSINKIKLELLKHTTRTVFLFAKVKSGGVLVLPMHGREPAFKSFNRR
jgi:thermitase